jgi:serine/threonine protein kinase
MEFAEHGNLRAYLRQKRSSSKTLDGGNTSTNLCLNTETTLKFALQIALGMEHLSAHKCIHRDLAARNVLVFNGEKLKISDFGLAKDMHYQEYYRKTSSVSNHGRCYLDPHFPG